MADWSSLRQRGSGKWQIPLFLLATTLLGASLLYYRGRDNILTPAEVLNQLAVFEQEEAYGQVVDLAQQTLLREGLSDQSRGHIHLHLARATAALARTPNVESQRTADSIIDAYSAASVQGIALTARDFDNLAHAHEWRGRIEEAVKYYEKTLALGISDPTAVRRHILLLRKTRLAVSPAEYGGLVDQFLSTLEPDQFADRLWAVEQKLQAFGREDNWEAANGLLLRERDTFASGPLAHRFRFLEALVLYRTGRNDEAERLLRVVRNQVSVTDETHARTGWLLGRVILHDGGPQRPAEAASFFTDVIENHRQSIYAVASRIGLAEAYAYLDRHDDAVSTFRLAMEKLTEAQQEDLADRGVLRASLSILAEAMRLKNDVKAALDYAELMGQLVDDLNPELAAGPLRQLRDLQRLRAEELDQEVDAPVPPQADLQAVATGRTPASRKLFAAASETGLRLARLPGLAGELASAYAWDAAELAARSGRWRRAIELYDSFAAEHPRHPLVPRSLLRVGQLQQALGDLHAAIHAFQECFRRYPRTLEGSRALIPLAECHLAMGPGHEEMVEKSLRLILDDPEVFTPQAAEFADALFLLGEVQNRRGTHEEAIATLEEVVQRYPQDPRLPRALFLLADSYRQSALTIRDDLGKVQIHGEREDLRRQLEARLRRARELYQSLITTYESRGTDRLSPLERTYLRLSSLYVADCHFEMQDHATALKLYEAAAAAYADTFSALAAYVQIINCHVFLGERAEARAALARALILTDVMPESAARGVSPESRADWKRYFEWLGQSELF